MQAHNTFAAPDTVKPEPFSGAKLSGGSLEVRLPAKSVVVVVLR
jgi:alpha-N-arabinofuranosidase